MEFLHVSGRLQRLDKLPVVFGYQETLLRNSVHFLSQPVDLSKIRRYRFSFIGRAERISQLRHKTAPTGKT